jgi:hypothetical protein
MVWNVIEHDTDFWFSNNTPEIKVGGLEENTRILLNYKLSCTNFRVYVRYVLLISRGYKGDIKMDIKEIKSESLGCIIPAQIKKRNETKKNIV